MILYSLFLYGATLVLSLATIALSAGDSMAAGWSDIVELSRTDYALNASAWQGSLRMEEGKPTLVVGSVGRYHNTGVVLKEHLKIPQGKEEYLHVHFQIYGFADLALEGQANTGVRIYLTPVPVAGSDPYIMANVFFCVLSYQKGTGTKLDLYQKINHSKGGFGELLYSGMMPEETWPMGIDIYLGPTTYRLTCNQNIEPNMGPRSGYHALPRELWNGDLIFGLRVLNLGTEGNSKLSFGDVRFGTALHNP
jgi:hypothetical protein